MDFGSFAKGLQAGELSTRREYHVLLGQLIEALEKAPKDALVILDCGNVLSNPHSYRGYYTDLAFEIDENDKDNANERDVNDNEDNKNKMTVAELLKLCHSVHNTKLEGWKGGEYLMDDGAVLWISSEGCSPGRAILTTHMVDNNKFYINTKEIGY